MYFTRNLPNTRIDVADALRGIAAAGSPNCSACSSLACSWGGIGSFTMKDVICIGGTSSLPYPHSLSS